MISGMFAGFVNSFFLSPIELVKCRLQLQTESRERAYYKGSVDCLKKIISEEGVTNGLFKGLVPTITREVPCYAGQFGAYEVSKYLLWRARVAAGGDSSRTPTFLEQFVSGGVGGFFCWFFSYPQDIIKTKL